MIGWSSTIWEYSWLIWFPLSCIHSHCQWSAHQCTLDSIASDNSFHASNLTNSCFLFASLSFLVIRILFLINTSIVLDILKPIDKVTSSTSLISIRSWAINELLFREYNLLKSHPPIWFNWGDCSKCPSSSTITLTLHRRYFMPILPIYLSSIDWHSFINIFGIWYWA